MKLYTFSEKCAPSRQIVVSKSLNVHTAENIQLKINRELYSIHVCVAFINIYQTKNKSRISYDRVHYQFLILNTQQNVCFHNSYFYVLGNFIFSDSCFETYDSCQDKSPYFVKSRIRASNIWLLKGQESLSLQKYACILKLKV